MNRRQAILGAFVLVSLPRAVRGQAHDEAALIRVVRFRPVRGRSSPVVTALAMHPGGGMVATGGDDHLVRLWSLPEGKRLHMLDGHSDWVRDTIYAPDGMTVATAGNDRRVIVWDVVSGRRQLQLDHKGAIAKIAYSHDGQRLAVVGFQTPLRVYDASTGALLREMACPCLDMRTVAFSADGSRLAAGGRNGQLRLWSIDQDAGFQDIAAHAQRIRAVAFSHDGAQLYSAGEDRRIRVWNAYTGQAEFELVSRPAKILCMVPCGEQLLATSGSDNAVRLWDLRERRQDRVLIGHTGSVAALAHDRQLLISGGFDTTVRIWNLATDSQADRRGTDDQVTTIR